MGFGRSLVFLVRQGDSFHDNEHASRLQLAPNQARHRTRPSVLRAMIFRDSRVHSCARPAPTGRVGALIRSAIITFMKERFDDDKYYDGDQDFGPVSITNFVKVMKSYSYERYTRRFRTMADRNRLARTQRPKLNGTDYTTQMDYLWETTARVGEAHLLSDPKAQKIASRLLILGLFDTDVA